MFCSASGPEKTAAICYALGWTQHSKGSQLIRTAAILQLLLGNIGRPGGGILALRGHASIQGSTDIPTLFDLLPGYLTMPLFKADPDDLAAHVRKHSTTGGMWANLDKYLVSLLKAFYGDAATKENDFGFGWLPRLSGDHSHMAYWLEMADGNVEGLFAMGDNPAVAGPNAAFERRAMTKLKWLVVRDSSRRRPPRFGTTRPKSGASEFTPEDIETEVFLLPAAGHAEKEGTFTNTQRLLQFREKAVDAPGDARSESWFIYHLWRRLKEKASVDLASAQCRTERADLRLLDERTDGRAQGRGSPSGDQRLQGGRSHAFARLRSARERRLHGVRVLDLLRCVSRARRQPRERIVSPEGPYGHGWGFAWPADRRILYNRASARPDGSPWSERKKLVWWDSTKNEWTGSTYRTSPRTSRRTTHRHRTHTATQRLPATDRSSCTPTDSDGSGYQAD